MSSDKMHFMKPSFRLFLASFLTTAVLVAPAYAANEKELFVVAQRAFEDGFYDVSLRYITQLLEEFPNSTRYAETKILEGQCYFFKKQYLKAFTVFKELVDKDYYKDASLFWLGETYLKGGDFERAREQYNRLLAEFGSSIYAPQAHYSLAWSYFEKGQYEDAKQHFRQLIEKFPSNNLSEDAVFKLGECEYNAGHYEAAALNFGKYIEGFPLNAKVFDATFNIAESYYYLEQYSRSLEFYKKARELAKSPKSVLNSFVGQGWSLIKLSKFDEAIKIFEEAQSHARVNNLGEEEILLAKGSALSAADKNQDAIAAYTELINRYPGSFRTADGYLGRANMYYLINDFEKAISDYSRLIETYSSELQFKSSVEKAKFGLAWTYLKSGQIERSIESFQSVFNTTDNKVVKVSALTQIGDAYQGVNQFDKAIEAYDRVLKEMPDSPYTDYIQYRLGLALLKADRLEAAILAFQSFKGNYPKSKYVSDVNYYLAVAYFKQKDWPAAVQVLEPLVKSLPADNEFAPEARQILGLSLFNTKQYAKALDVFGEMQKAYVNNATMVQAAQLGMAKVQYEQGNTKEAVAAFKEIAFKYPKTDAAAESYIWLGQHAMTMQIYQLAVDHYSAALENSSSGANKDIIHYELGRAFHGLGKYDKALEHYRQVRAEADAGLQAKAKLAIADIFSRELDASKAVETYRSIIATSPDFARAAYMKIALIHRRANQHQDELKAYESALQASKGAGEFTNAEIQFSIGDTYEIMNDGDKAIEAYFKIPYLYEKEKPWVIKSYLRIAKIYENKEQWDKAVSAYQKIVGFNVDESKFAQERVTWIAANRNKQ